MNIFQMKTKPHGNPRFKEFIEDKFLCIGWPGIGNLDQMNKDKIRDALEKAYGYTGHRLGNALGQVNTFVNTMKTGDMVLITEKNLVYVGIVGDYKYEQQYDNDIDGACHRRSVEWIERLQITSLESSIQRLISNRNTICQYPEPIEESGLLKVLGKEPAISKENNVILDSLFTEALAIIAEELKSTDPERRLKAATEIIRLKTN